MSSKAQNKHLGCIGRGWSGEDFVTTECLEILFEKAKVPEEHYLDSL